MGSPVRFPFGVNNIEPETILNQLTVPDWSQLHVFLDDFDKFTLAQWGTGGVGPPPSTPALVGGDGGLIQLTNTAVLNDNNWLQQLVPAWTITPGKKLFFRARAALNATAFGSVALGLQVTVAANNFLTPTDGVFLRKSASNSGMELVNRVGGVETITATIGNYSGGQVDVAFYYDGKGTFKAGIGSGSPSVSLTPAAITALPLGITIGVQNTSAAVRILTVDQIFCAKER